MARRNDNGCIFDDGAVRFCAWNDDMSTLTDCHDGYDRLEFCHLCQDQDILKTTSYSNTVMKDLISTVRNMR